MGSCCTKAPKNTKKVFILRKISDTNEQNIQTNGEASSGQPPQQMINFNNISPRRKSSFFQHSNQNNGGGKVTFQNPSNTSPSQIKRGSIQIQIQPRNRVIRETSIIEKRRTSEGLKMINEYFIFFASIHQFFIF